jgi:hypothetical protein
LGAELAAFSVNTDATARIFSNRDHRDHRSATSATCW